MSLVFRETMILFNLYPKFINVKLSVAQKG